MALLRVCKVKRAQKAEEIEHERAQFIEYIAEQRRYKEELDEIELANKLFEDMMNEYEAWWNIDYPIINSRLHTIRHEKCHLLFYWA